MLERRNCTRQDFDTFRCDILNLRDEMVQTPELASANIRWMREGIGVFLDDYACDMPMIWFGPTLRFNTQTVSFEHIQNMKVMPAESTPGGVELWRNKSAIILGSLASCVKQNIV